MVPLLASSDPPCVMFLFVAVVILVTVISALSKSKGATTGVLTGFTTPTGVLGEFDRIRRSGTPALGIILRVDNTGTTYQGPPTYMPAAASSTVVRNSVHVRNALVDIEVPGRPPYQVTSPVIMPLNMADDVLPGASVELRVDPNDQKKVVIVGPGSGFAGFASIPLTFQKDGST